MGEIADALRRARRQISTPGQGRERAPGIEEPPLRRPVGPPEPRALESIQPAETAPVPRKGADLEACRQLAVRVRSELERCRARSVAIVSAVRNEGKSTVSCDLGLGLASMSRGRKVAVLDLDLRKPSVTGMLGLSAEVGIEAVLRGEADLDQIRHCVDRPAIDIYPGVERHSDAHELLVLSTLGEVIQALESRYEIVVVDTAPALLFPDANLILEHVDACIAVTRAGETRARMVRQLIDLLPPAQILGHVFNGARALSYRYGYGYEGYRDDRDPAGLPARGPEAP